MQRRQPRALNGCLIGVCALCCFVLCFTDSYRDPARRAFRYGFVTPSGRLLQRAVEVGGGSPPPRDGVIG
ncbi:hypothetical protein HU200_013529 [Digitaria exilis]|uniref:Uncharacterized protein n=1 Tax=Digitaria exilis TaxID=1010633 RepID=A0A835FDR4_9POAL|nr:hypothetical protein HU200_013529 [Digitaria exilis]